MNRHHIPRDLTFAALAGIALLAAALLAAAPASQAQDIAIPDAVLTPLQNGGHVLVMRHGRTAPGTGDPEGFSLDDCASQRNLSTEGRTVSRRLGAALARHGVTIDRVVSSPWCRCVDTARLVAPGLTVEILDGLGSFHEYRDPVYRRRALAATTEAIAGWSGPGTLLMVTHGANIRPLTGHSAAQGGAVVLKPKPGGFDVIAAWTP